MLLKMKRRICMRPVVAVLLFGLFLGLLCFLHYFTFLDVNKNSKYIPVVKKKTRILSPADLKMKKLFDRSMKWSQLSKEDKMKNLLKNPVYEKFNINKPVKKKKVNLLLIVSSGPRRIDRRKAIRDTWWKQCKPTYGVTVECVFFTDEQNSTDKYNEIIQEEQEQYKDMHFQPLRGGIEFGVRFLYHMVWAMSHYEFDYFMRTDDDYFFCLERFLYELPQPMASNFHWGYTHCILQVVRPEESMILFSRDLVQYFLSQKPHTMRCHPWADQMIGVWTTDLGKHELFRHDLRLHHAPIVDQEPKLRLETNICKRYIAIHGTYADDMRGFWKHKGPPIVNITTDKERDTQLGNLIINSEVCDLVHTFNYLIFEPEWQYEPQQCIYDPIWDTKKQAVIGGVYSGREEDKRLSLQDLKRKNKNRID